MHHVRRDLFGVRDTGRQGLAPWESVVDPWERHDGAEYARPDPTRELFPSFVEPEPEPEPGVLSPSVPAPAPPPAPRAGSTTSSSSSSSSRSRPLTPTELISGATQRAGGARAPRKTAGPRLSMLTESMFQGRITRSMYSGVETHGAFGLVDTGELAQGHAIVLLHVPSARTGADHYSYYSLDDLRPGDVIHVNRVGNNGAAAGAALSVGFVTRHKYYRPGARVATCLIGVPVTQWRAFVTYGGVCE